MLAAKFGGEVRAYDQIDNAPEERARGITISTTRVEYQAPSALNQPFRFPSGAGVVEPFAHELELAVEVLAYLGLPQK